MVVVQAKGSVIAQFKAKSHEFNTIISLPFSALLINGSS
jgi:hypothetical protein